MENEPATMDIPQAAAYLKITEDAVRKRIKRGKLQSTTIDGRIHVVLPQEEGMSNTGQTSVQDVSKTEVETMSDTKLADLREELEKARAEIAVAKAEVERINALRDELTRVREEAAVAKAEVGRMEAHVEDLRKQLDTRTIEMQQERTNHEAQLQRRDSLLLDLQKKLALPAPEPKPWWKFWK